jgi:hypothetical protein
MSSERQDQREEGGWGIGEERKTLNYCSHFQLQDGCVRLGMRNK